MSDSHELMKQAWIDYPSQDNEGFQPDRGGFKCGWFMAWNHQQKRIDQLEKRIENLKEAHIKIEDDCGSCWECGASSISNGDLKRDKELENGEF